MKLIVQNLVVNYDDQGGRDRPVLLFLHGWKNDLTTFDPIVQHFISDYRVVRLDLPGFGGTQFAGKDWTLDDYVDFVEAFIKKLGIHVTVLVGHSFGGRVIIKGIARGIFHPEKIILIASAGIATRKTFRSRILLPITKIGKAITAIPPLSFARESLRKKLYQSIGSDYGGTGTLKGTYLKVIREDLSQCASTITVPTLLIWGEQDTQTPLADGKRFLQLIPRSQLHVIADAGHFVHREKPEVVVDFMKQFLAS